MSRTLDFMVDAQLNTLVLHQNDLIDCLVLPEKYINSGSALKRWPIRYHRILCNRHYLSSLITQCHDRSIKLFLQTKELSFDDSLLKVRPDLWGDHGICPSDPFWAEFATEKVDELLKYLPDLDGIVISLGSHESRVSPATGSCTCERCQELSPVEWYRRHIDAFFQPLNRHGKTLVIRDFSFKQRIQQDLLDAVSRVSSEIVISLKNTPHDFYPTFPHNARIGSVGKHRQWIEFDVWGEFFGLGVFPCVVVDDMRQRLKHCFEQGATGAIARTDWEVIPDASVFDSLNKVNLQGFSMLTRCLDTSRENIITATLDTPLDTAFGCGRQDVAFSLKDKPLLQQSLARSFALSWDVIRQAIYVQRFIFHEDCMFPRSMDDIWLIMTDIHSLSEWELASAGELSSITPKQLWKIMQEKEQACLQAHRIRDDVLHSLEEEVPDPVNHPLYDTFDMMDWYVNGFKYCAQACFYVKCHIDHPDTVAQENVFNVIEQLADYGHRLADRMNQKNYPHLVRWLLNPARIADLAADLGDKTVKAKSNANANT